MAGLLHGMAFEMKSACSQTQTRQVEKPTAWFPVPSRQFESHEESRSNAAPLHVSVSPHESGDRYREGSARWAHTMYQGQTGTGDGARMAPCSGRSP